MPSLLLIKYDGGMVTTSGRLPAVPEDLPVIPDPAGPLLRAPHPGETPVDVYQAYLDTLPGQLSKKTMGACLDHIAVIILEEERGEPLPPDHEPVTGAGRSWWLLRRPHTLRILALLTDPERNWAPAYINKHLSALRGVLKECWNQELISTDDYLRAKDIKNLKGKRLRTGRAIHPDEVAKLLASCARREGPGRYRDTAMFMVLQSTGIRREELAHALIEKYDPRERSLDVIGKGNKERRVWLHPAAVQALEDWLVFLGERQGPMFRAVNKHRQILPDAITPSAVNDIVERHREAAGLLPMSPHDFRRTLIGNSTTPAATASRHRKIAGHEHSSTTDGYDRRGERGLRDLIDRLPIVTPPTETEGTES